MLIGIILASILIILIIFVIGSYNSLVKMRQVVREGYANLDVYLKKRYDLIPNLVETVKGYANHEKSTLEEVTKARSMITKASNISEKMQGEGNLDRCLKSLFAVSESYPDLKANSNFIDLQNQLKKIEEDISNARKYYNAVVRDYNIQLQVFPKNIVASMFNFKEEPMFSVSSEEERQNVKISFS